jgi:hypothetical protein
MTDPSLVFVGQGSSGARLVVNFGLFSAREATQAEDAIRERSRIVP